ncbi:MAG: chorismate mutase [Bacteroidales bacterium]|nr:chorismate mutase [Bacteroidales bacterium]
MKPADKCTSIEEVRTAIDMLDKEIISLIRQRFDYVKEVVRFKKPDKESIIAQNRFDEVIESRRTLALEFGLNPDVIEKLYRYLLNHFIEEEMKIINKK